MNVSDLLVANGGVSATVQLISADRELYHLCRDILAELRCDNLSLIATETYTPASDPDFCIWDCSSSAAFPVSDEWTGCQRHLLLVERGQVGTILNTFPCTPIGLLLKPITRATFTAFLEHAMALGAGDPAQHSTADRRRTHSDRNDILQYLLQANLRLQEYDQDRTNFLARATHDFRAPLTALNGYCGLLLEGLLGPLTPEQKEVLQRMQHSAKRLARMASALYDLSVARQTQMRLQLQARPIEECVEQAVHELALVSEEKHISITVQMTPPPVPLYFDPVRIVQLLVNLLDNACKFAPKYSVIEIFGYPYFWDRRSRTGPRASIERRIRECDEPNSYRLDIRDAGSEIPREILPLIFEEYTSYSGPGDRSGGGLGLAICKTIAESHVGRIWVNSGQDGVTFSLVLPFQPASHHIPAASVSEECSVSERH